jgi:hypothetical protein
MERYRSAILMPTNTDTAALDQETFRHQLQVREGMESSSIKITDFEYQNNSPPSTETDWSRRTASPVAGFHAADALNPTSGLGHGMNKRTLEAAVVPASSVPRCGVLCAILKRAKPGPKTQVQPFTVRCDARRLVRVCRLSRELGHHYSVLAAMK